MLCNMEKVVAAAVGTEARNSSQFWIRGEFLDRTWPRQKFLTRLRDGRKGGVHCGMT